MKTYFNFENGISYQLDSRGPYFFRDIAVSSIYCEELKGIIH